VSRIGASSLIERDWRLVERAKTEFWIEQKAAATPSEALRLGDDLRRYVQTVRPDWPDAAEREADRDVHARVSEALRHAANYGSGPTPGSSS